MLKDVVNAKASMMMIYKSLATGKTVEFELTYEELKEMKADYPMSDSEIQRFVIENKIEVENARCPYKNDEGTTTTKVALVDGYMVFYNEVDESLFDMKELGRHHNELKENVRESLKSMRNDPSVRDELQMLVGQNIGVQYRYYGNKSKEYVDLIFTPKELSKYVK